MPASPQSRTHRAVREGWEGWDEYAPFYDWENARTLGRRDVPFWNRVASGTHGPVLELGCGTGRVTIPLARAGAHMVGIDRSAPMLARAVRRARRMPNPKNPPNPPNPPSAIRNPQLKVVRGDVRWLPFADRAFPLVIAPYGILQSLVPDVPNWREYRNHVQLRGRSNGARVTLVESVSQDRDRRLTTFEQRFVERRGRTTREHRFLLTFRTLTVPQMSRRLERAGFAIESVFGDYRGRPWDARADVWIILAKRV